MALFQALARDTSHYPQASYQAQPTARLVARVSDERFADLGAPKRIWAISAINGDTARLANLHDALAYDFQPGDRLVYMGNYLGAGSADGSALDEVIQFRRFLLAMPGLQVEDITYLRGTMEEMWHKLLQIQFCPNPSQVLDWMESFGMGNILAAYGSSIAEARIYLRDRPLGLVKWTNQLRTARRNAAAHEVFASVLKRAAYTREISGAPGPLLFVHAGLDPRLPLSQQNDQFWWGSRHFGKISQDEGFAPFARVVRGYNPAQPMVVNDGRAVTIDAGAGRGGELALTCFAGAGQPQPYGQIIGQWGF